MIARGASFDVAEVAFATGGRLEPRDAGPGRVTGVCTDTRDELAGRLFVALVGERFDAHDFLERAVEAGAAALLVGEAGLARVGGRAALDPRVDVVVVPDTLRALGDLARHHRRGTTGPVVALTGSNGKTSTKEILRAVLSRSRSVLATDGNLNNLIGLPLTLLGLEPEHEVCVAEMGMNAKGEIARMVEIAEPTVGLVTNVGTAHIGELGSIEAIASAKGEMFRGLAPEATAVANADDPRVMEQLGDRAARTFGRAFGADVRLLGAEPAAAGQRIRLSVDGAVVEARLSLVGAHNAMNAAAAVAAATAAAPELDPETLARGLEAAQAAAGRLTVRRLAELTVIDDAYNANAHSALAAIDTARTLAPEGRLVAAFGAMKELGTFSEAAHREVGEALARAGARVVATFGPEARALADAASAGGVAAHHEDADFDALGDWLSGQLRPGDVVLIKGSRATRMERLIPRLEGGA